MTAPLDSARLDGCGCCETVEAPPLHAPSLHANPPGLDALAYRAGTHPTFLARMLARIHACTVVDDDGVVRRPLAALTTRSTEDPSIALLDAGAVMLDVLTFYQERIANEGFLRTATERRSVLELARAIGYELRPGVAAEAFVAFTVEDAPGAPAVADVPAGTQIMSTPAAQGELPQTFETSAALTARAAWNALRPRQSHPHPLTLDATRVYAHGIATGVATGDLVLLRVDGASQPRPVLAVERDPAAQRTRIDLDAAPADPVVAPTAHPDAEPDPEQPPLPLTRANVEAEVFARTWREADLQAFLTRHSWDVDRMVAFVDDLRRASFTLAGRELLALRERVGFFGHNAPRQEMLAEPPSTRGDPFAHPWDDDDARPIWEDSQGEPHAAADAYLERAVPGIVAGGWVVLSVGAEDGEIRTPYEVQRAFEASRADYAMSGRATALRLDTTGAGKPADFLTRTTTAHVRSEPLALAPLPATGDLVAGQTELWLDGMAPGLRPGQAVALSGEEPGAGGLVRVEMLTLEEVLHAGGYTRLVFEQGLAHAYRLGTVTVNANVVGASHGESVPSEVLGGGDGSVPNQAFTLRKPPLTHVSAANAQGAASTLTVRVDRVAWRQVPSLYGCAPGDRVYVVRHDDRANATVIFGDGVSGARPPTGRENVTATYRSGIGAGGEVGAGSLTLLRTRPFGVRGVTNPLPAAGAEDPETLDGARANAPLTVLTLDRIVSLQDYEDFARAFAGIGKARAASVWNGEAEVVHLTVTDAGGGDVAEPLYGNLLAAIEGARDPLHAVVLASYRPFVFHVTARVLVDEAYLWDDVEAAVEAALVEAFGFERRAFAQPVAAAEVVQVMHAVAGVLAVDLEELYRTTPDAGPPAAGGPLDAVLDARPPRYDEATGQILAAELLLVHPLGITLTRMLP